MKTRRLLVFGILLVLTFAFTACEGPAGPQGEAGADGAVFVWKGAYADEAAFIAANGEPQDGWAYYNSTEGKTLVYHSLETPPWQVLVTDGTDGADGSHGTDGAVFVWKGSYANLAAFTAAHPNPQNGWAYYDESLKQSRIYNNGAWDTLAEQGEQGNIPYIGVNGNWWINGVDTGVLVDGVISISGPTKIAYLQGEAFSSAGLVVTAYYSDGTDETITGYSLFWNGEVLSNGNTAITAETGNKTITVQWHNKIAVFIILVQN